MPSAETSNFTGVFWIARMMVDSGTPARDISMTSALVSGLGCWPVCAKAASPRNRSGRARFMTEILVEFWVIRSHGSSRSDRNGGVLRKGTFCHLDRDNSPKVWLSESSFKLPITPCVRRPARINGDGPEPVINWGHEGPDNHRAFDCCICDRLLSLSSRGQSDPV